MKTQLLLLALLLTLTANAQKPINARADSLFADWNKPGSPGAAVGVVYQGKLIYAKSFGEYAFQCRLQSTAL